MSRFGRAAAIVAGGCLLMTGAADNAKEERLWEHRNLGKAFYENPTTLNEAVVELKKALDLTPSSVRERVNYGLALLRAGNTAAGVSELEKAQKQDPSVPHTWFNLGMQFKKAGDVDRALEQFTQMVKLAPDDAPSQYNLGTLYKLKGDNERAIALFEKSAKLDPNLAGPHFQLYGMYRRAGKQAEADRQRQRFEQLKKEQAGAVIPENLEWGYYAELWDDIDPRLEVDAPKVPWKFTARDLGPGFSSLLLLDADGDGQPDVVAWGPGGAALLLHGTDPVKASGLESLKEIVSISAGDFDNDGLADLCVLTAKEAVLFRNAKGRFEPARPLAEGTFTKAVFADYDHDYDLDLLLFGASSKLMRNLGAAGWDDRTADFPFVQGKTLDVVEVDWIADAVGFDYVATYADRTAVLYRDRLAGHYEAVSLDAIPAGTRELVAFDWDQDGSTDLVAGEPELKLWRNRNGKLIPQQAPLAHGRVVFFDPENRGVDTMLVGGVAFRNLGKGQFEKEDRPVLPAHAAADFNRDGRVDLISPQQMWTNVTSSKGAWVLVNLTGVRNLKLSPGAQVEIRSGSRYQKQSYNGVMLHFGMGAARQVDMLRITWPNALIQTEPRLGVNKLLSYKELPRLSGSCPMIFTWNGAEFEFLTDVLGVAPLGASSGDGEYFPVDHDEYVRIPGRALTARDGAYEVRITEELREVSYLDRVRLLALDHPAEIEVFTNEKFVSPPYPEFRLFGVRKKIRPLKIDAPPFRNNLAGVADLHAVTLDFGKAAPSNRAVLYLHGWVDWADGSAFRNASQQSREGLILPYLQVRDESGNWKTVIKEMGIPAGKPKTIAVDLTGKFLSPARQIRIVTNLCVYWDGIFLGEDTATPETRLTEAAMLTADLHFRGWSRPVIDPERRQPERFVYGDLLRIPMWNPTPGNYTRYGDVRPLLETEDDRLAIMGSGDELKLRFNAGNLPPLPAGWTRDFLLHVDGWAKDADANTAYSQTVEPLPFHGMSAYPYAPREHFPDDLAHRLYRDEYNTRPALRILRALR